MAVKVTCYDLMNHYGINIYNYLSSESMIDEWPKHFSDRFYFDNKIEGIEPDLIKKDFCSIIIRKNNKNRILYELSAVGINESFVYPELEYVAKKIKNKYINII